MTNNDIDFVSEHLDAVYEYLENSEGAIDCLLRHYTNGDIDSQTMDRAILRNIHNQIVGARDLITSYAIELQARKH